MRYKSFVCTIFSLILISAPKLAAQDYSKFPKWGDIPLEDLRMTTFEADSSANALILLEYGRVRVNWKLQMLTEVYIRIKILTEKGYDQADISLRHSSRGSSILGIKGQVHSIDSNGNVKTNALRRKEIYKTSDDVGKIVTFTLPSVSVGSVIEYKYTRVDDSIFRHPIWKFQGEDPTRLSIFVSEIPEIVDFMYVLRGSESASHYSDEMINWYEGNRFNNITGANYRVRQRVIVMKGLPAMRDEPFTDSISNYRTRLLSQVASIKSPRGFITEYLKNWDAVATELLKNGSFGPKLLSSRQTKKIIKEASLENLSDMDKLMKLHDWIISNIRWNEKGWILSQKSHRQIIKAGIGDLGGINLLFIALLRTAGLEANPVIYSTRSNGDIQKIYPVLGQFNSVLAEVAIADGQIYYIDPTDESRPYHLPPVKSLEQEGFLIKGNNNWEWVKISVNKPSVRQTSITGSIADNGSLTATFSIKETGYRALFRRQALRADGEKNYMEDWLSEEFPSASIDSYEVDNLKDDLSKPLVRKFQITIENYAAVTGDMMHFSPVLLYKQDENPYKNEERLFPIDYSYPRKDTYVLNLELPKGFKIVELPENKAMTIAGQGIKYVRMCSMIGNSMSLMTQKLINKSTFQPKEYAALRGYYMQLVKMENENAVLVRQ